MTQPKEKVVAYFYDEEVGNYTFGGGNPMRPHRARMVYSLLNSYGVTRNMIVHRPEPRSFEGLTEYHADDYIDFLRNVTPGNAEDHLNQLRRFNMGQVGDVDCPVFDGVYEYCQIYSGGSVNGATLVAQGKADLSLNWSGGMHHAKKAEASGFCYVNDIVLCILELLKGFGRVLYVDIDIHHGDGVEEAFYLTDRVMTVSFHKYGEFFPGTGAIDDIGYGRGKHYTVNVPLKDGMDDDNYKFMFEPIMSKVMEMYQPGAIVMCCGADSLSGDKLGCFNLSMEGHSNCIEFLSKFNVPMVVLGGGGYTLRNVARCWTYETGRLLGLDLPDQLPDQALHEYNYYLDTFSLRIQTSNMKNMNTREELEDIKMRVMEHLRHLPPVPSVQMAHMPPANQGPSQPEEDPDARGGGQIAEEMRRTRKGDDSDEEGDPPGRTRRDQQPAASPSRAAAEKAAAGGEGAAGPASAEATQPPNPSLAPASLSTSEALNGRPPSQPTAPPAAPPQGDAAAPVPKEESKVSPSEAAPPVGAGNAAPSGPDLMQDDLDALIGETGKWLGISLGGRCGGGESGKWIEKAMHKGWFGGSVSAPPPGPDLMQDDWDALDR
ncbi:hypothetical protein DUNSADRAFT_55 [Dunaliella salina]|uniref:histone deacetylase n=1 Tax=Dunaliella salina TaxID=3046 RepID=A0ABQ7HAQ1_DUNSA|nr:hypothetical protein DUNSADRAFT_55 [Dunaliella salina]|eukprot:KAF5843933.1 hypothetical protein DUNSADRAFT_55 [Dunaliella salina]